MTKQQSETQCPLCANRSAVLFCHDRRRTYFHCPQCDLIFVPPRQLLMPDEEKTRYDLHQNDPADLRYRKFLNRLFRPLEKKLPPDAHGLDFGCGPGPTLSVMFEEGGYHCDNYDLYYAVAPALLKKQYDFLTCSEAMEHFRRPRDEFEQFLQLVRPGGWIGIMTQLHNEAPVPFERWHYKDDDTHIAFFSRRTFQTLGRTYGLLLEYYSGGILLFQIPEKQDTKSRSPSRRQDTNADPVVSPGNTPIADTSTPSFFNRSMFSCPNTSSPPPR
jgi:hypothetical protein